MKRMRILVVVGGATVALILGTAFAGEQRAVTIVKQNAVYVPPTEGAVMYEKYCASCHGLDGRGYGPALSALNRHPIDLTRLTAMNAGDFPGQHVRYVLLDAGPTSVHATDMPAWSEILAGLNRDNPGIQMIRVRNLSDHLESLQEPLDLAGR
jgi:mono/diheme cytochrome c family protein